MNKPSIASVSARRVWDSRGRPTVEAHIVLDNGATGTAIAPAGASRGRREAVDLRDGGERLGGQDVQKALAGIAEEIAPKLTGLDPTDQAGIDRALIELDGTPNKSRLGGNALTAVSLAALHAGAAALDAPLHAHIAAISGRTPSIPLPEIQIFGGGAHAGQRVDIQDFMIMAPGARDFDEALAMTAEVYRAAGSIMARRGRLAGVADEGGYWPEFGANEEALETLTEAIALAGEKPGENIVISLDIAASEFAEAGGYRLALEDRLLDPSAWLDQLAGWLDAYPIVSVEDPTDEADEEGMIAFTKAHGDRVQIVGDDYFVTSAALVEKGVADKAGNAVLIKVNQAGTFTETRAAVDAAKAAGFGTLVSARSGETEDVSISHMAVGLDARQLKVGSFTRSERMAKWNECLRIADALGSQARFAGGESLADTWWGRKNRAG